MGHQKRSVGKREDAGATSAHFTGKLNDNMEKEKKNWQARFDRMFKDTTQSLVYHSELETDKQAKPLYLHLIEFIETVYNEGVRDGKADNQSL